jgi:hypothetical protein
VLAQPTWQSNLHWAPLSVIQPIETLQAVVYRQNRRDFRNHPQQVAIRTRLNSDHLERVSDIKIRVKNIFHEEGRRMQMRFFLKETLRMQEIIQSMQLLNTASLSMLASHTLSTE